MPAYFSHTFTPGCDERNKRAQPSALTPAALRKRFAPRQLQIHRDEYDQRYALFGHLNDGQGCSCCQIHRSHYEHGHAEERAREGKNIPPHLPRLPRQYRAFTTERACFLPGPYPGTGNLYKNSPVQAHIPALGASRQPYDIYEGHAYYTDELSARRRGHVPASPGLHPIRSNDLPTRYSSFDSAVPEERQIHAFNGSHMAPIEFKAAAGKLFSVLRKAGRFLDTFLRSFKQETAAAYMDRTTEWKRKVDRYNTDLVLPDLKVDGKLQKDSRHRDK